MAAGVGLVFALIERGSLIKKFLVDLILMIMMIVGAFMLFIGMLQFNPGFKSEVAEKPFVFSFSLICGSVLMIGSMLIERIIRDKSKKER